MQVCDTVAEFAMVIFEDPGWPELLPFLFHCAQSRDARLVEGSLLMFGQLAQQLAPALRQYLGTLHEVLLACLSHSDSTVRLASMRAATNFIQVLPVPAPGPPPPSCRPDIRLVQTAVQTP